jgi:hypothetical protein
MISLSVLMGLTGFLTGGLFAFASLSGPDHQKNTISSLYAADLAGGCLGSLLGSLIFIPFWGMPYTALAAALWAAAGILLI